MNIDDNIQGSKPLSPFLTIWYKPRQTIRNIVGRDPKYLVLPLAMVSGFLLLFGRLFFGEYSWVWLIVISLLGGSIIGIIQLFVTAAFFKWVGNKLGGKASYDETKAAVAWSGVPGIVTSLILYLVLTIIGREYYITTLLPQINTSLVLVNSVCVMTYVPIIYSLIIEANCLGEVHQFSIWKGFLSIFLGMLVVGVLYSCIFILIPSLFSSGG